MRASCTSVPSRKCSPTRSSAGYSIDSRMQASLAVAALDHAVATRSPASRQWFTPTAVASFAHESSCMCWWTMDYADRWVAFGRAAATLRWSRSSRSCNATFWTGNDAPRAQSRLTIITWIERTHHRRRLRRALGKLTAIEFELLHTAVATAA
jgi:putative transposase